MFDETKTIAAVQMAAQEETQKLKKTALSSCVQLLYQMGISFEEIKAEWIDLEKSIYESDKYKEKEDDWDFSF